MRSTWVLLLILLNVLLQWGVASLLGGGPAGVGERAGPGAAGARVTVNASD